MPFDPNKHLMQIRRMNRKTGITSVNDYLEAKWRLVWFRQECPEGVILTKPIVVDLEKGVAVFEAYVEDGKGGKQTAHGSENVANWVDFIEKAETSAVSRALGMLGYGTQFAPEFDD